MLLAKSSETVSFSEEKAGRFEPPIKLVDPAGIIHVVPLASSSTSRGERIRTSDPLSPRQVRYQAALRPVVFCCSTGSFPNLLLSLPQDGVGRFCSLASLRVLDDELVDLLAVGAFSRPFNDCDKDASVSSM